MVVMKARELGMISGTEEKRGSVLRGYKHEEKSVRGKIYIKLQKTKDKLIHSWWPQEL